MDAASAGSRPLSGAHLLARLLWEASRWRAVGWLGLTIATGLAPPVLNVTSSRLVGGISTAAANDWSTAAIEHVARVGMTFLLALIVIRVAGAVAGLLTWQCNADYLTTIKRSRMTSALAPSGLASIEGGGMSRLLTSMDEIERSGLHRFALPSFGQAWTAKIGGLASAALLFGLHWWAPLVLYLGWFGVNRSFRRWASRLQLGFGEAAGTSVRRANYFRELALSAAARKELRIFGLQEWAVHTFDRLWADAMRATWRQRRVASLAVLVGVGMLVAAHVAVLGALVLAVQHGLDAYRISLFGQAILGMSGLGPIGGVQVAAARARVHARQLDDLRRSASTTTAGRPGRSRPVTPRPTEHPVLAVHRLRFTYPGSDRPILRDVTFEVPAGQRIALVGRNGAGKSTLINLICGLYEPDGGAIAYGGARQAECDPTAWRRMLAVLPQETIRLQATLYDNIALACPPLRDHRGLVEEALSRAGGRSLLSDLPNGWDTWLDPSYPNGVDLSGGQWQRIALARAFLALHGGDKVLILDEPSASLDVRAEAEIFAQALASPDSATTLLVTHRLSTVRFADRIVVLDDGRITEDGTHEQLMAQRGLYAHLYALQAEQLLEPESGQ